MVPGEPEKNLLPDFMSVIVPVSFSYLFCLRDTLRLLAAFLAIAFTSLLPSDFVYGAQRLTILHSSEHHGAVLPFEGAGSTQVGGMARRATVIEAVKAESQAVLIVDSGDILIGTAFSSFFRGEPDIKTMNLMGYHAMAAGNHDFDFGLPHLQRLQDLATFPILCTNVEGHTVELPCQSSAIVRIGDLVIGLMGIVGHSNFPDTFNREVVKVLDLQDPITTVRRQAKVWKEAQEVDLIVVITHQDTQEDLALLVDIQEIDVVVGGHTEGFDGLLTPGMRQPTDSVTNPSRVFVKTHRQGRTLGRLDLLIDEGQVMWARAQNMPVDSIVKPTRIVQELLAQYRQRFKDYTQTVVGRALLELRGESPEIRTRETNLGNLLADLLREEFQTQIALLNSGQIRASLPAGPVNAGHVLSVLPFDSSVVTLSLTGRQVLLALENSVSRLPGHAGRFLQISGLRVLYDLTAPPGGRVREVKVNGQQLDLTRVYSVGTDAFLADGGDGYAMFEQTRQRIDHQIPMRDVLLKALAKVPLTATKDQRIRFVE